MRSGFHIGQRCRRGFTLVETALAMVIVGVGVVSLLQLLAAGTMVNSGGTELTTAVNLANTIHEISISLPFQNPSSPTSLAKDSGGPTAYTYLWDMNGDTYSPPLDVRRQPITKYSTWSQKVTITTVDPNNVTAVRPNDPTVPTARVTVVITHNNREVYQASWLITAPNS
jgi:prepilin-type N-terminal cleavage/methylation domain-containing protein